MLTEVAGSAVGCRLTGGTNAGAFEGGSVRVGSGLPSASTRNGRNTLAVGSTATSAPDVSRSAARRSPRSRDDDSPHLSEADHGRDVEQEAGRADPQRRRAARDDVHGQLRPWLLLDLGHLDRERRGRPRCCRGARLDRPASAPAGPGREPRRRRRRARRPTRRGRGSRRRRPTTRAPVRPGRSGPPPARRPGPRATASTSPPPPTRSTSRMVVHFAYSKAQTPSRSALWTATTLGQRVSPRSVGGRRSATPGR